MRHAWQHTSGTAVYDVAVFENGYTISRAGKDLVGGRSFAEMVLAAETRRLAQRVQELEATVGTHLARIADLEHVIRERGHGTPAPEEIDREAFEALDPEARFLAYREAAGWACHARGWEAMAKRKDEELRSPRANFDEISRRLAEKESDRLRLEMLAEERLAACDQLRAQVTEREHQLVLAKETAATLRELDVNRQRVILGLREQLAASESRGRQYSLELAEKAEAIREIGRDRNLMAQRVRELEEALGRALSDAGRLKREADGLAEQLAGEIMENHALKMTIEEGSEIEAELAGALAAGHGEDLKPCVAPCPGHLGPKASAAVDRAAGAWRALETSLDELKAILREHGLLPAKYEDEEGERLQGEVPDAGPRIWRSAGPPLEERLRAEAQLGRSQGALEVRDLVASILWDDTGGCATAFEEGLRRHNAAIGARERARIRQELLEELPVPPVHSGDAFHRGWAEASEVARAALDRVCPATGAPGKNSDTPADFRSCRPEGTE